VLHANGLLDACDARAREAHADIGEGRLEVDRGGYSLVHACKRISLKMAADARFPALVSLACHDIATPLATVYGFARTLARLDLDQPAGRYVEMIDAASSQIGELVDQLRMVARIEAGSYQPVLADLDSLELARGAAEELGEERVTVCGEGATVHVDPEATRRALAQLARAAARHGGYDSVTLAVRASELELAPIGSTAEAVLLGADLRELGAAAAAIHVRALGGSLECRDERLFIRLPT
jgi:signal transduction histidine kinase